MPKSRQLALYGSHHQWTEEQARGALAALDASGLSPFAFAKREGLDAQRLYRWRRRLARVGSTGRAAPAFVEVRSRSCEQIEVVLGSGRTLRVLATIDPSVLRRLVETLE